MDGFNGCIYNLIVYLEWKLCAGYTIEKKLLLQYFGEMDQ